jgi:pSer/pThr/pTyr-binding forkhead associated (FHA) protein
MEEKPKESSPITMILYVIQNGKKEPSQNWEIIPEKTYIVGRSKKEADISINEKLLSRKQAELTYYNSSKIIVKDLESRNGTFLNKKKIDPSKNFYFNADDVLSFGTTNNEIVFFNQNEKNEQKK